MLQAAQQSTVFPHLIFCKARQPRRDRSAKKAHTVGVFAQ
jgi:hypothetical protein